MDQHFEKRGFDRILCQLKIFSGKFGTTNTNILENFINVEAA